MIHKCENCLHEFTIIRHTTEIFGNKLYIRTGTGKNMLYKGDMNREYAFCPECGSIESQLSAEARDQDTQIQSE